MPKLPRPKRAPEPRPTPLPGSMAALLPEYLAWGETVGYADATTDVRRRNLLDFFAWCEERGLLKPEEVTRPVLLRYQRHLFLHRKTDGKPLSWASQHGRQVVLRSFFRWLTVESHLLYNPASELLLPRRPHRIPRGVLSMAEAEQVLRQADPATPEGVRDRAILETLYSTGMRRLEVVQLGVFDVDFEQGLVTVRQGKGKRDRVIPIGERACRWIDRYLVETRPSLVVDPQEPTLFLSNHGRAFHPQFFSRVVKSYIERSGVAKPGCCHLFRHTMATLMLDNGADIRFIQQMLGHAEISTTQIYTHVSVKKLKEIHERTHPARLERVAINAGGESAATAEDLLAVLDAEAAEEATETGE